MKIETDSALLKTRCDCKEYAMQDGCSAVYPSNDSYHQRAEDGGCWTSAREAHDARKLADARNAANSGAWKVDLVDTTDNPRYPWHVFGTNHNFTPPATFRWQVTSLSNPQYDLTNARFTDAAKKLRANGVK